jgi:hypothetical protein
LNATLIKNVRLEINILNRCRPEGAWETIIKAYSKEPI